MLCLELMRPSKLVVDRGACREACRAFTDIGSVLRLVFMEWHRLACCASATRGSIGWKRVPHRDGGVA